MSNTSRIANRAKRITAIAVLSALGSLGALGGCSRLESGQMMAHHNRLPDGNSTYHSEILRSQPTPLPNRPVTLTLAFRDIAGNIVRELPRTHEKPVRVLIVSKDLRRFAHEHPITAGDSFRLTHTFAEAGEFFLIVDYQGPNHGQIVDRHRVRVGGPAPSIVPLIESPRSQRTDGLEFTLRTEGELRKGEVAVLHFDVTDVATNLPVANLEPYLGTKAHFVVLSSDGEDFVHAHALDGGGPARVSAQAVFPRAGLYKLWIQVQRSGEVVTVPFVLRIGSRNQQAGPTAESHLPGDHLRHAH